MAARPPAKLGAVPMNASTPFGSFVFPAAPSRAALLPVLLVLIAFTHVHAQIILISSSALVSVTGSATVPAIYGGQNQNYATTRSASNFTSFSEAISGDAFAQITILPPFALYLGTTLHAASSASQTTTIGPNLISIKSLTEADAWAYSQVGTRGSDALSHTEITFRIDHVTAFSLTGSGYHFQSDAPWGETSTYTVSLISSGGSQIFQAADNGVRMDYTLGLPSPLNGTLMPGIYTFKSDVASLGGSDPIGDGGRGQLSLDLQFAVPDTGSTATLLALGGSGLLIFQRLRWRPRSFNRSGEMH